MNYIFPYKSVRSPILKLQFDSSFESHKHHNNKHTFIQETETLAADIATNHLNGSLPFKKCEFEFDTAKKGSSLAAKTKETMSFSPDKENQHSMWFRHRKTLNNALFTMRLNREKRRAPLTTKIQDFTLTDLVSDKTSLLSDEIMLNILAKLPKSQRNANVLVSKRWLNLQGRLVRSIKLLDWDFLLSGRLFLSFPNLVTSIWSKDV